MSAKFIIALVVAAVLLATVLVIVRKNGNVNSPPKRLSRLVAQRADYQIFIGVPLATPNEWATATNAGGDSLHVQGFGTVRVADVRAFAVAYPTGQMVDSELCGLPWPKSLDGLSPASRADSDVLTLDELKPGNACIRVSYGASA